MNESSDTRRAKKPTDPPEWAEQLLHAVHGLQRDMVKLMSDQSALDQDVQKLTDATTAVEKEIADLKAKNPTLDLTGLDAAVANLQSAVPAPTPAPGPAPAPTPPVGGRHR